MPNFSQTLYAITLIENSMKLISRSTDYLYEGHPDVLRENLDSYKTLEAFTINPFEYFGEPHSIEEYENGYKFSGWLAITSLQLDNNGNTTFISMKSRITILPLVCLGLYALLPILMLFAKNVTVNGNPNAEYYERLPVVFVLLLASVFVLMVFIIIRNVFERGIASNLDLTRVKNGTQHNS